MSWVSLLDIIYPVGSYYFSVSSTSPANIVGGTWNAIEAGRFICAAGDGYSANSTGGASEVALKEAEMPKHRHVFDSISRYTTNNNAAAGVGYGMADGYDNGHSGNYSTSYTGSGEPHENRPPYIAAYIWKRVS